jgi:protein TonB
MLNYIRTRRGDLGCPLILSFLIHSVGIVLLLSTVPPASKQMPIAIEFIGDLKEDSDLPSQKAEPKPIEEQGRPVPKAESPSPLAEAKEQVQEESPVSVPVEEKPIAAPVNEAITQPSVETGLWPVSDAPPGHLHNEGKGGGTGSAGGQGSDGDSPEIAKNRYLKEHFAYIRDLITKNLSYPPTARRMGCEGKVVVSFVVNEDGHVSDIKVIEGSGFGILDKNAVETIKKASPFPKPPVRAELVMPIVYKIM